MTSWHFFIPAPEPLPIRDRHPYIRKPSMTYTDRAGTETFSADSVCLVPHQVNAPAIAHSAFQACSNAMNRRLHPRRVTEDHSFVSSGDQVFTVFEIIVSRDFSQETGQVAQGEVDSRDITAAFDFGILMLNQWLSALAIAIGAPVAQVRREALPSSIPFAHGEKEPWELERLEIPLPTVEPTGLFVVNQNFDCAEEHLPQPDEVGQWIDAALVNLDVPGPFIRYTELFFEAERYERRSGDYNVACILYASACETLIDELLQHLFWEQGLSPHEAAEHFLKGKSGRKQQKSVTALMMHELYPVLTGKSWRKEQLREESAVSNWYRYVATIRNGVIHGGAAVDASMIRNAQTAVEALNEFFANRLFEARERFPRTTLAFLGEQGLKKRGKWEQFRSLEPSLQSASDRMKQFRRWSDYLTTFRKFPDLFGSPVRAEESSAHLVYENGRPCEAYVVHEAGSVAKRLSIETARQAPAFQELFDRDIEKDARTVIAFRETGGVKVPAGARWDCYVYEALRPFTVAPPELPK